MEAQRGLDSLAARLRRPPGALHDLAHLTRSQMAELESAVDAVCERQREQTAQALRKALPWPLRALILRGTGKP